MASKKLTGIHVYATGPRGRQSLAYDEFEFNDGLITLDKMVDELVEEGCTKIEIEVNFDGD